MSAGDGDKGGPASVFNQSAPAEQDKNYDDDVVPRGVASPAKTKVTKSMEATEMKAVLEKVRRDLGSAYLKHRAMAIHHQFMSCLANNSSVSDGAKNEELQPYCQDVIDILKKWTKSNISLYCQMLLHSQGEEFPPPAEEKADGKTTNRQMHCLMLECKVPLDLISNNRLRRTLHFMRLKWYNDSIYRDENEDNLRQAESDHSDDNDIYHGKKQGLYHDDLKSDGVLGIGESGQKNKGAKKEPERNPPPGSSQHLKSDLNAAKKPKYHHSKKKIPVSFHTSDSSPGVVVDSKIKRKRKTKNWVSLSWTK